MCSYKPNLTVLVDADSCPRAIRSIIGKAAVRRQFHTRFCAMQTAVLAQFPVVSEAVKVHVQGESVDEYILHCLRTAQKGSWLVITRDIPLAETVVNLNQSIHSDAAPFYYAMNDRGIVFEAGSVQEYRSLRDAAADIRLAGLETLSSKRNFDAQKIKAFADSFDRLLTRIMDV